MSYKWYNRNRLYEYGYYDINKKRYYNEDSGKWVSRLNKKVIEEKYIRYEFSYWDEREIKKEFGYELVERIGRFLFLLYKKGIELEKRRGNRWVYVDSSKICNGILSSRYIEIIKRLRELKVIDIKYGVGKFGKKKELYELNKNFFSDECKRRVVYIRNSRLIRFLDKLYSGDLKVGDSRDEFINWEIESCKNVDVLGNSDGIGILLKRRLNKRVELDYERRDWEFLSNKKKRKISEGWSNEKRSEFLLRGRLSYELMKIELDELKRGGFSFNGFDKDNFSGRYGNIFNKKEKEFRSVLKLDGENVVEVDMVNGYISLLYRVFKGINEVKKGGSKFDDYIKKIVGDIDVSDFLEKYKICFEGDIDKRIDFYKFLGIELGRVDMIVDNFSRIYMKELVLYLINGESNDGKRKRYLDGKYSYDEIMKQIFCESGYRVLEKIKNSNMSFKFEGREYYGYERFKNMSRVLMSMEVIIMKGIWKKMINKGIYYISLYDGMMIRKSDIDLVMNIIGEELIGINSCIRFNIK